MTAAPSGYGEEAGDGPEARRDASPLPGGDNGSVCCYHLLYPGYHGAASLPEKVGASPLPGGTPAFSTCSTLDPSQQAGQTGQFTSFSLQVPVLDKQTSPC